jgi:hypothetical protein
LVEAEVIQPGTPYAEPDLAGDLFTQSGPYAELGPDQPPLAGAPPARHLKKQKKKGGAHAAGSPKRFSDWVAQAVLFFVLPAAALFTVIGLFQRLPQPAQGVAGPNRATQNSSSPWQPPAPPGSPASANEPPPSGYPVTLWNASKRSSGEFSAEYRQDRGPLDSSHQYYWVVADPGGKIEFPLPASVWKQRDKLSGKPAEAAPGQFMGPYTTFIEEQVGTSRSRISNDVQVTLTP